MIPTKAGKAILTLSIIFCLLLIFWVILKIKSPTNAPEVIPGKPVVRIDTVKIHDTLRLYFPRENITVEKVPVATTVDTSDGVDACRDSAVCYGVKRALESGGYIGASVCSKYFPVEKPIDLSFTLDYKPGNDTLKSIFRVDTLYKKQSWTTTGLEILCGFVAGGVIAIWATH
ncbi:MAG: hypothetical protein PHN88_14710 [Ignavibacteria bacterium]|nr:hypothetical protein [Ignavibacteria bacterium]